MRPARKTKSLFSKRLIALRRARGLTQEELAKALGMSPHMVGYYEAKAQNPTACFIRKVAAFFEVPSDQLLNESVPPRKRPGPVSRIEHQLELVRRLPREQQKAVSLVLDMALKNASQAGG